MMGHRLDGLRWIARGQRGSSVSAVMGHGFDGLRWIARDQRGSSVSAVTGSWVARPALDRKGSAE